MREFDSLILAQLDGRLSEADVPRFQELVRGDDDFVARFAALSVLSSHLNDTRVMSGERAKSAEVVASIVTPSRWRWSSLAIAAGLAVAAGVLIAVFVFASGEQETPPEIPKTPVATLVRAENVTWTTDTQYEGSELPRQRMIMASGHAQIIFNSGAVVDLTGPCDVELTSRNGAHLHRGKLSAFVPPRAQGFSVTAPDGVRLIDLGTEFSMRVNDRGHTEAYVSRGSVELVAGTGRQILGTDQGARVAGGRIEITAEAPPELISPYRVWKAYREELLGDRSLIVMYDFADDVNDRGPVYNLAGSGADYDGVMRGGSAVAGRFAQEPAIKLNGKSDHVSLDVPGEFKAMTIAMWVRIDKLDKLQSLFAADGIGRGVTWNLQQDGRLSVGPAKTFELKTKQPAIRKQELGRWSHLVLVADTAAGTTVIYRNGKPLHTQPLASTDKPLLIGPARLGHWHPAVERKYPSRGLTGAIDELMIFNRPLDADEIDQLYSTGRAP